MLTTTTMPDTLNVDADDADLSVSAIDTATRHVQDLLRDAICHQPAQSALIVADTRCALARALTAAYRRCLPNAQFIDFDAVTPEHIQAQFAALAAGDLVVLVQSSNFRLDAFPECAFDLAC